MHTKFLFVFLFISQVSFGQSLSDSISNAFNYVDTLLKKDSFTIESLDLKYTKEIEDLVLKFQRAIIKNKSWFEDYSAKNYRPGEGLPYHENFGITKEEYQKFVDMDKNPPELVVKETGLIKLNRNNGLLTFKAVEGNFKFIESITIDMKNRILRFLNDTIPFSQEINTSSSVVFGAWHGFNWKKIVSNYGENDIINFDNLVSTLIEINIGRSQKNGKIIFTLKYKKVNKAQVLANTDIPCYLN